MENFSCDRCGKCCIEYNAKGYQIHFRPDAPFFSLSRDQQLKIHPLVKIYLRVKDHFLEKNGNQMRYLIPTKKQIQPYLTIEEKSMIKLTELNGDECIFLDWEKENYSKCQIHQFNPKMCHDYPLNKGGACLNHFERRFTEQFFKFQEKQIGFAVKILQELHRKKIKDPIAWKIVTFLMDFGKFPLNQVRSFFIVYFHITSDRFDQAIHVLREFTLISIIDNKYIEGISLKEIENVVDKMMKELGWDLPASHT